LHSANSAIKNSRHSHSFLSCNSFQSNNKHYRALILLLTSKPPHLPLTSQQGNCENKSTKNCEQAQNHYHSLINSSVVVFRSRCRRRLWRCRNLQWRTRSCWRSCRGRRCWNSNTCSWTRGWEEIVLTTAVRKNGV